MTRTGTPFDIDEAMTRIEAAVAPYPKAAMFELREAGYTSAFEQLIACMLSIRTRDETSVLAAPRLFAVARTPAEIADLPVARIAEAIADVSFAPRKAEQIHAIAVRTRDEFGGELPCDDEILQSLPGVGPKCAHLVLGVACGVEEISVDIHVHRVTNRWGYVTAPTPERTMLALQEILPKRHWIDINRLLVPFGKHICTGTRPKCSTCPVLDMCAQVGVTNPR
jgi:endonuclease-3